MKKKVSIIEVTFGGYTRFYLTIDALYPEGIYKTVFEKVDQSVLLGEVVQLGFNLTNLVLERNGKTYFEYKKVR